MEVTLASKDNLNAVLKISISKADYTPRVESELKKTAKKVSVPGFRPGNAPFGMVKKMYGKSVFIDEVNKMVSESLYGYLDENKLAYLAQPLMSDSPENQINFEEEGDFVFHFELGLAPEIKVNIDSSDTVTRYKISVTDEEVEKEIANIRKRAAVSNPADVAEATDVIYLQVTELNENGETFEGGVADKSISTTADLVKDKATQKKLIGVKAGDELKLNLFKLFNENETVISSSLGIAKEAVNDLHKEFKAVVTEIKRFTDAELDQKLFDETFGPGVVTNEEEFRTELKKSLESYYASEAENMFEHELDHVIQDKHHFELPETFLKRWLIDQNPDSFNAENVEEKFPAEAKSLRYVLLRNEVLKQHDVKINSEDIEAMSMAYAANALRQYGLPNADEELVKRISENYKKEKGHLSQMSDMVAQRKFIEVMKGLVTPVENEVTVEEFYEIIRKHNEMHNHDHQH